MVKQTELQDALTAFELHLDVYGARRERWSDAARRRFDPLLAEEPLARQLLAEARALDQVLESAAPPVDAGRLDALSARIVGLATAEHKHATTTNVVDLSSARQSRPVARSRFGSGGAWRMASALAASLIVGIYLGTAPVVVSAVETIAESVGIADTGDTSLALFDDGTNGVDEDLL